MGSKKHLPWMTAACVLPLVLSLCRCCLAEQPSVYEDDDYDSSASSSPTLVSFQKCVKNDEILLGGGQYKVVLDFLLGGRL